MAYRINTLLAPYHFSGPASPHTLDTGSSVPGLELDHSLHADINVYSRCLKYAAC